MNAHKVLNIPSPNITLRNTLSKELNISPILAQLLINRGISSIKEAQYFLDADIKGLLDPYSFSEMSKAVSIIRNAAKKKDKVMVFGDYDVDGITSVTVLKSSLKKIGVDALHYLPHRIKEGYGLTKNILQHAIQNKIKVLITVDCGITNHHQVAQLKKHGVEVIITDHHEPVGEKLPAASSIINPKVKSSNYGYRDLAGVGVAYKLSQAITGSKLLEELDLVSIGTIADSAPLTGENRIIVKEGLAGLQQTRRAGLRALIDNSGMRGRQFNSTFVSFILGPRINASGRMDTAEISLNLLMSEDEDEAARLAKVIESHNRQRQKVESRIMDEAQDLINKEVNFKEHKIIVIAKEDWHQGVLGIVASKLAERFYRPAIVISLTEDLCKGSARSIKNFHLFGALKECEKFLDTFGGHAHAAGLVIAKENINEFRKSINRLAHERLAIGDLFPSIEIDMQIGLSDLDEKIIAELSILEPFGNGNPEPLFYTRSLKLKGEPQVLSRETLKFWITDGNTTYQAIGFGMSGFKESLVSADCFDLVYTPKIDAWNGEESVILEAKEIFFR